MAKRASRQITRLRAWAIANTLFPATTLGAAVERLGFVQADPIRAPARAQDLILRPRVQDYRVGDLDAGYAELGLEEGMLYAYALPLLWRDAVVGWANLSVGEGGLEADVGYVRARPRGAAFRRELEAELARVARFLEPR